MIGLKLLGTSIKHFVEKPCASILSDIYIFSVPQRSHQARTYCKNHKLSYNSHPAIPFQETGILIISNSTMLELYDGTKQLYILWILRFSQELRTLSIKCLHHISLVRPPPINIASSVKFPTLDLPDKLCVLYGTLCKTTGLVHLLLNGTLCKSTGLVHLLLSSNFAVTCVTIGVTAVIASHVSVARTLDY